MRTCMIQFVKEDADTGEIAALDMLETLEIIQAGRGWVPAPDDPAFAEHAAAARAGLQKALEVMTGGQFDMVILDEVCFAVAVGLLSDSAVLDAIEQAPDQMVIVLTGRGASAQLVAAADTVTEMRSIKHGMNEDRKAQQGVEF